MIFIYLHFQMSDLEKNGPTQVALNFDLTSHMQLNGLNGMSHSIGMLPSKPFGERGELSGE